jgi:hypothetical protein
MAILVLKLDQVSNILETVKQLSEQNFIFSAGESIEQPLFKGRYFLIITPAYTNIDVGKFVVTASVESAPGEPPLHSREPVHELFYSGL